MVISRFFLFLKPLTKPFILLMYYYVCVSIYIYIYRKELNIGVRGEKKRRRHVIYIGLELSL
jgi:hypothetical protein